MQDNDLKRSRFKYSCLLRRTLQLKYIYTEDFNWVHKDLLSKVVKVMSKKLTTKFTSGESCYKREASYDSW